MLALAFLCTAIAFVVFFKLIAAVGPARSTLITFVNPAVAVVVGAIVLDEEITATTVAGFALVLVGCWLATRQGVEVVPEAPIVAGPPTPAAPARRSRPRRSRPPLSSIAGCEQDRRVTVLATFVGGWGHAEPLLPIAAAGAGARPRRHVRRPAGGAARGSRALGLPDARGRSGHARHPAPAARAPSTGRPSGWSCATTSSASSGRSAPTALGAVFADRRPHVVVCDEMDVGAVIAAERLGHPVRHGRRDRRRSVDAVRTSSARPGTRLRADHGAGGRSATAGASVARCAWRRCPGRSATPRVPWPSTMRAVRPPILDAVDAGRRRRPSVRCRSCTSRWGPCSTSSRATCCTASSTPWATSTPRC